MILNPTQTAGELAKIIGAEVIGNPETVCSGINEIHVVTDGDLVFSDHPKYFGQALESAASVIILNEKIAPPTGKAVLFSDDPFRDFNILIKQNSKFVAASQAICASATIGEGTVIQPNVFVGNNVSIGKNCLIHPNVSIYDGCQIGDNVVIHANTVLGSDAFYFKKRPSGFDKLVSCGNVVIGNDVEIGANCSFDRGVTSNTTVGNGTIIDNQVHVGHDTVIGEKCLVAAQVGIAGCVTMGNNVTIWGQVGIVANITIEDGVTVYAQAGVGKNLKANGTYFGSPADTAMRKFREMAAVKQLPAFFEGL